MNTKSAFADTLKEKQEELKGLVAIMRLNARPLSMSENEKIEALEYGQKFRTQELVKEFQVKELEVKIHVMKELIAILKKNTFGL
jgi:hypothetical protein